MSSPCLFVHSHEGALSRFKVNVSELDDMTSHVLGEQLAVALDSCQSVEIDLASVDYICSTTIAKFVGVHQRLTARQGTLSLKNVKPFVHEVLQVTGIGRLMEIRPY